MPRAPERRLSRLRRLRSAPPRRRRRRRTPRRKRLRFSLEKKELERERVAAGEAEARAEAAERLVAFEAEARARLESEARAHRAAAAAAQAELEAFRADDAKSDAAEQKDALVCLERENASLRARLAAETDRADSFRDRLLEAESEWAGEMAALQAALAAVRAPRSSPEPPRPARRRRRRVAASRRARAGSRGGKETALPGVPNPGRRFPGAVPGNARRRARRAKAAVPGTRGRQMAPLARRAAVDARAPSRRRKHRGGPRGRAEAASSRWQSERSAHARVVRATPRLAGGRRAPRPAPRCRSRARPRDGRRGDCRDVARPEGRARPAATRYPACDGAWRRTNARRRSLPAGRWRDFAAAPRRGRRAWTTQIEQAPCGCCRHGQEDPDRSHRTRSTSCRRATGHDPATARARQFFRRERLDVKRPSASAWRKNWRAQWGCRARRHRPRAFRGGADSALPLDQRRRRSSRLSQPRAHGATPERYVRGYRPELSAPATYWNVTVGASRGRSPSPVEVLEHQAVVLGKESAVVRTRTPTDTRTNDQLLGALLYCLIFWLFSMAFASSSVMPRFCRSARALHARLDVRRVAHGDVVEGDLHHLER